MLSLRQHPFYQNLLDQEL